MEVSTKYNYRLDNDSNLIVFVKVEFNLLYHNLAWYCNNISLIYQNKLNKLLQYNECQLDVCLPSINNKIY